MNRRAFLIGTAATAVALRVPTIAEAEHGLSPMMASLPSLTHLKRMQADLVTRIMNPPAILHEDGTIEIMKPQYEFNALATINRLIEERT